MRLPNAESAIIDPRKTRDYLFVLEHPQNDGKAVIFEALGYTRHNWQDFERDIRAQHLTLEAIPGRASGFGEIYEIIGRLIGPTGSATIKSVWQIDFGTEVPRFITAYPQ